MSTESAAAQITAALSEAKASARMIIESGDLKISEWENLPGFLKAARARTGDSPLQNATAEKLAMECLTANPVQAMALINKRIADRAAAAADLLANKDSSLNNWD